MPNEVAPPLQKDEALPFIQASLNSSINAFTLHRLIHPLDHRQHQIHHKDFTFSFPFLLLQKAIPNGLSLFSDMRVESNT